ncbi:hypothetical protein FACS189491_04730 [Spirochaetia bacterium]|nr:hypothetical protein FACS189491_04730 [Spirochaetia bacterium]
MPPIRATCPPWYSGYLRLTNVVIPNSVTTIKERAFLNLSPTSITIPGTVTIIGQDAFSIEGTNLYRYDHYGRYPNTTITIGANIPLKADSIRPGFSDYYNSNGKRAGVYAMTSRFNFLTEKVTYKWSYKPQ